MFVRLLISQHFKESFDIASSSVHERARCSAPSNALKKAVDVLLMRYPHVKVVPIISPARRKSSATISMAS